MMSLVFVESKFEPIQSQGRWFTSHKINSRLTVKVSTSSLSRLQVIKKYFSCWFLVFCVLSIRRGGVILLMLSFWIPQDFDERVLLALLYDMFHVKYRQISQTFILNIISNVYPCIRNHMCDATYHNPLSLVSTTINEVYRRIVLSLTIKNIIYMFVLYNEYDVELPYHGFLFLFFLISVYFIIMYF